MEENEDFLFSGTVAHLKRMTLHPSNEEEEHEEEIAVEASQLETAAVKNAGEGDEHEDKDDGFEFAFVPRDPRVPPLTADELFADCQIHPTWPIFNQDLIFSESNESDGNNKEPSCAPLINHPMRKLLTEERSRPSLESGAVDGIPVGSYCVWRPKAQRSARPEPTSTSASALSSSAVPGGCKKSNSTGSSKVWRFRDLMHRSSSNSQDTMVFLSTDAIKRGERKGKAASRVRCIEGQMLRETFSFFSTAAIGRSG